MFLIILLQQYQVDILTLNDPSFFCAVIFFTISSSPIAPYSIRALMYQLVASFSSNEVGSSVG